MKAEFLSAQARDSYFFAFVFTRSGAFGSINFGDTEKIMLELQHVVGCIKQGGRIYFRVNPGLPHPAPESKWIQFYNWSPEFALRAADALNVTCSDMHKDGDRLYFVYHK